MHATRPCWQFHHAGHASAAAPAAGDVARGWHAVCMRPPGSLLGSSQEGLKWPCPRRLWRAGGRNNWLPGSWAQHHRALPSKGPWPRAAAGRGVRSVPGAVLLLASCGTSLPVCFLLGSMPVGLHTRQTSKARAPTGRRSEDGRLAPLGGGSHRPPTLGTSRHSRLDRPSKTMPGFESKQEVAKKDAAPCPAKQSEAHAAPSFLVQSSNTDLRGDRSIAATLHSKRAALRTNTAEPARHGLLHHRAR